jgi:hypothetical protein
MEGMRLPKVFGQPMAEIRDNRVKRSDHQRVTRPEVIDHRGGRHPGRRRRRAMGQRLQPLSDNQATAADAMAPRLLRSGVSG